MEDDDVECEESIVVVVAAAFANITVQILYYILKRARSSIVLYVIDSPRVACFLRLLLSAGAMRRTRVVPMDDDDENI